MLRDGWIGIDLYAERKTDEMVPKSFARNWRTIDLPYMWDNPVPYPVDRRY